MLQAQLRRKQRFIKAQTPYFGFISEHMLFTLCHQIPAYVAVRELIIMHSTYHVTHPTLTCTSIEIFSYQEARKCQRVYYYFFFFIFF